MTPSLPPSNPVAKRLARLWRNWHPHAKGKAAEIMALAYFLLHGYRPFPRPWRELAQTDLLLRKAHVLVLVEVKARSSRTKAHLALSREQKQRLARQSAALAARYPHLTTRLDLFFVYPAWPFVEHIRHVSLPRS